VSMFTATSKILPALVVASLTSSCDRKSISCSDVNLFVYRNEINGVLSVANFKFGSHSFVNTPPKSENHYVPSDFGGNIYNCSDSEVNCALMGIAASFPKNSTKTKWNIDSVECNVESVKNNVFLGVIRYKISCSSTIVDYKYYYILNTKKEMIEYSAIVDGVSDGPYKLVGECGIPIGSPGQLLSKLPRWELR
jgi:hypothetical protein